METKYFIKQIIKENIILIILLFLGLYILIKKKLINKKILFIFFLLISLGIVWVVLNIEKIKTYSFYLIKEINSFQHNSDVLITKETYTYVYEYKKQLLQNITNLLNDLGIRFVIAHGNLLEYVRNKPILHDDDLDIRFYKDDFEKWEKYCDEHKYNKHNKYNLLFDNRILNINAQKKNGIQIGLIEFKNDKNIKCFPKMEIHIDLVVNTIKSPIWIQYIIDYNNLRKITYLDVNTYAPSEEDSHKILSKEYGKKYIIPNKTYSIDINNFQ